MKVKCTGYKQDEHNFTIGKIYEVNELGHITADDGFEYKGCPGMENICGYPNRYEWLKAEFYDFEEVKEENMKVRCTDRMCGGTLFTIGKIYEIENDGSIACDDGFIFTKGEYKNGADWLEGMGWYWFEKVLETKTYPKITIKTDGKTTTALMWENGKCVKSSVSKCHDDDEFDYGFGANLALERLFEEEKVDEFVPHLYNDYGIIGKETNLIAMFGEKLYVGDVVEYFNTTDLTKEMAYVIDYFCGIGISGIHEESKDTKNGIVGDWQIRKVKSYKDLKHGETYRNIKAVLKED